MCEGITTCHVWLGAHNSSSKVSLEKTGQVRMTFVYQGFHTIVLNLTYLGNRANDADKRGL